MRIGRNIWVALGIAAVSFGAGRWSLLPAAVPNSAHAEPPPQEEGMEPEFVAEMKSWEAAGEPGPHHEILGAMTGDWTADIRIWMAPDQEPIVAPTRIHREWVLRGRYLREDVISETEFGAFQGLGYSGYSNVDGVFQSVWMQNNSTVMDLQSGSFDPDTRRLVSNGGYRDPHTGRYVITRSVYDMSDENRHVAHMYAIDRNGREYRTFEGVFVRE